MARPERVRDIIKLRGYKDGIKKLARAHKLEVIKTVEDTVELLATFSITRGKRNHPLEGNKEGYWDLHIGDNLVLIYRYVGKSLEIDLELKDLTDHDHGLSKNKRY